MRDYTPEGIAVRQMEETNTHLYYISKRLKKINRGLRLIAFVGITMSLVKYKNDIKELIKMKGE